MTSLAASVPELGHLLLWLAFGVALLQASLPLAGAQRGNTALMALAPRAAQLQLVLVAGSFACLTWSYWVSDFSVLNVAQNSHTTKPDLYKITGVWGNHEGSLLLWVLILSLSGAAVASFSRELAPGFRARALAVQGMIGVGFLAFLLFTSNPFTRLFPVPADGQGLNPVLQDPGLAFHPPLLYCGYVGLSVTFSFAVAALIEGNIGPQWARWVRPWTLVAWAFLTVGIALGSWWAYYELGWGGFWFWDPVENASLMPWLAATALFHSTIVLEKRDTLKSWTVLLAILAFSLSLMGTFIVRSGVLTSVHAFAVDPARGLFILAFLGLVIGGALTLYAWRASSLGRGPGYGLVSRESGLMINNIGLGVLLLMVFTGTLYPLVAQAFGRQVSVGPPYFNQMSAVLGLPLLAVMAVAPYLAWRQDRLGARRRELVGMAVLTALGVIGLAAVGSIRTVAQAAGFVAAAWGASGVAAELIRRAGFFDGGAGAGLARLARLPRRTWGVLVAHGGFALLVFSITAVTAWQADGLAIVRPGQSVQAGGFTFKLEDVQPVAGRNFTALEARIGVMRGGEQLTTLISQTRTFTNPATETTEAGIQPLPTGDLYAVLGKPDGRGGWQLRVHWKPYVWWMWAAAGLMALGGVMAIPARRATAISAAA